MTPQEKQDSFPPASLYAIWAALVTFVGGYLCGRFLASNSGIDQCIQVIIVCIGVFTIPIITFAVRATVVVTRERSE